LIDPRGRVANWNAGAERILGYAEAEIVGESAAVIFTPEDREAGVPEGELQTAAATGRAEDERWHLRKDGSRFWASGVVSALTDASGNLRGFAKILRDFTERKRMEETLRENEAGLRSLFESAHDAILVADDSGRYVAANRAAGDLLGVPVASLIGRRVADFWPEPHRAEVGSLWQTFLSEGEMEGQARLVRADGGPVDVEFRARSHFAPGRHLSVMRDITARVQLEERLRVAYEREHRIAETLQQSLLLAPSLRSLAGLEVEPFYHAALDEALVGGDFFDAFPLDGSVALVVGDASGKGLAAAARTAEVKFSLRAFAREHPYPGRTLARVNDFVCSVLRLEGEEREDFVVLSLAVVNPVNGEITLATAGAEPPFIVRGGDGRAEPIEASGLPLGIEPGAPYTVVTTRLLPGDILVLATDGIVEARRPARGPLLGYEGMTDLARRACAAGLPSLRDIGQALLDGARDFAGGTLQDDACLLLARLR
jgi:PAS domain S-box-containing protein